TSLNFLKISACFLPNFPLQKEQAREYCDYRNNRLEPTTRGMGVWRSEAFGSLPSSKATPTGLVWNKSLRSVVDGNPKGNGMRMSGMESPVGLPHLPSHSVCSHSREDIGRSKIAYIMSKMLPWEKTDLLFMLTMDLKSWRLCAIPLSACSAVLVFLPSLLACATTLVIPMLLYKSCPSLPVRTHKPCTPARRILHANG